LHLCFTRCHVFGVHVYLYSPNVWNDMYACEAELWCLTCWDVMFGYIRILVVLKGSEEMYAYIAEILCWMLSCDLMLSVHIYLYFPKVWKNCMRVTLWCRVWGIRILEFPKGLDNSYVHKAETLCQLFP